MYVNAFLKYIILYDYVLIKFILENHSPPLKSSSPNASIELSIIPMPLELSNYPGCGTFSDKNRGQSISQLEWLIISFYHHMSDGKKKGNADEVGTLDYLDSLTKKEDLFVRYLLLAMDF